MYKQVAEDLLKGCQDTTVYVSISYFFMREMQESLRMPIQNTVEALAAYIEQSQGLVERMTGRPIAEVIGDPRYVQGQLNVFNAKREYISDVRLW